MVIEPKKDTIVTPPVVAEPIKKDTVVVTPAPKVDPVVIEPKKDTIVTPPVVAEPIKKDTVVVPPAPKVEPLRADSTIQPIIKTDSAKVEINKDSSLPKEAKKELNNQLLNEADGFEADDRKNNREAIKPLIIETQEEEPIKPKY